VTAPPFPHYGLEHIGLTADDVDAAVEELRAKGAEIAIGPLTRNPGLRLAFVRGPEDIMIELVQRYRHAETGDASMTANSKIRVGIVGANPNRGFASIAHIPALQALPEFEIIAVCTTRQESAEAAARHFGVPLAFSDAEKLARHPDVDLVTVSVKVPDHYLPVMAAIEAGKHVYCEWPLGCDTDEAARMLAAAERKGIRQRSGCKARCRRRSITPGI
jgi:Oxidoreductase family, NAD-binding Rossmann fold